LQGQFICQKNIKVKKTNLSLKNNHLYAIMSLDVQLADKWVDPRGAHFVRQVDRLGVYARSRRFFVFKKTA